MRPRELTSSLGFLLSGVLLNERVDVALPLYMSVSPAKNTFFVDDGGWTGKGSILFSALGRLKVGVEEGGKEFLVGCAGVLINSSDDFGIGLSEGGTIAALPGLGKSGGVVFPSVDDVAVCRCLPRDRCLLSRKVRHADVRALVVLLVFPLPSEFGGRG